MTDVCHGIYFELYYLITDLRNLEPWLLSRREMLAMRDVSSTTFHVHVAVVTYCRDTPPTNGLCTLYTNIIICLMIYMYIHTYMYIYIL